MKCSEPWNPKSMNYRDKFTTGFRTLPQHYENVWVSEYNVP